MTISFVLGNGVSRQLVDPVDLKRHGTVYGCNALYRTFAPDVLISTDTPISTAIQNSGYSADHIHYTRKPLPGLGAIKIPPKYFGFSSGPAAVGLAAEAGHTKIYMLGFDLGPNQFGMFNNVYADTEFYKKSSATPTYTGNWVKQILSIVTEFKHIDFIRVKGRTTADVEQFDKISNIRNTTVEDLVWRINNRKDF
jgi:hypothetical protein